MLKERPDLEAATSCVKSIYPEPVGFDEGPFRGYDVLMKIKTLLISLMVIVGVAAADAEWLCRVELGSGLDMAAVARCGADVLMPLEEACLCRVDDADVARLEAHGFEYQPLDAEPDEHSYVYVMPIAGFDRTRLRAYGFVLTEDCDGVVLRTSQAGIEGLNRLPVELAGVGVHPIRSGVEASLPEPLAVDDSLVWSLVGNVNRDSIEGALARLVGFRTRYSMTDSCQAAMEWVRSRFEAYGCDSTYLDTFRAGWGPTAVGVKRGTVNERQVFVVCGHVDATSEDPYNHAPGSEDNGSGAICVLELCRAMKDVKVEKTIWFIGFSGEEQGLVGSDTFARRAAGRGDSIKLAINFDMVSYGRENLDTIVIYGATDAPPSVEWVDFFQAQADTFSSLKHKRDIENIPARRSDHYSFWKYGFPFIRGGYYDRTPEYHTTGDPVGPLYYQNCGTNNFPMLTELVKALVASVAKMAGAYVPTGVEERPGEPVRVLSVSPSVGRGPVEIRLSRPPDRPVRVGVFDAGGRRVSVLDWTRSSSVTWDGRDDRGRSLSAGIYLFRFVSDGQPLTARAVLTE